MMVSNLFEFSDYTKVYVGTRMRNRPVRIIGAIAPASVPFNATLARARMVLISAAPVRALAHYQNIHDSLVQASSVTGRPIGAKQKRRQRASPCAKGYKPARKQDPTMRVGLLHVWVPT